MKLCFYGASQTVTGSCYLLETTDTRILIDCGMFQGSKIMKELNYGAFPFDPNLLDAVILTHAHIDHSGLIPKLIKKGFSGPIYATTETIELCSVMLPDSGHIQEMEVTRKNRKHSRMDVPLIEPIYTVEDAVNAQKHFVEAAYNQKTQISQSLSFQFADAGHILGSAHVIVSVKENNTTKTIAFSGDIGTSGQPYVEDPVGIKEACMLKDPDGIRDACMIVMETTYGNRIHPDKTNRMENLARVINNAHQKGGNIIIPAFAINRTQDLLYYLRKLQDDKKIPVMPIYIDSPLAVAATRIFGRNTRNFDQETKQLLEAGQSPFTMPNLHLSETAEDSIRLNAIQGGAIIISASGMADAGRIKHHLKHNLWRHDATVIFVGYQAQGTLGRFLTDGAKEVTIHGEKVAVNAEIVAFQGFSAHADQNELLAWLKAAGGNTDHLILVHGEDDAIQAFSSLVQQKFGIAPIIPELGECLEIADGEIKRLKPSKPWLKEIEDRMGYPAPQEWQSHSSKSVKQRSSEEGPGGRTFKRRRKVLLSEANRAYTKLRKDLKLFIDRSNERKDYENLIDTFESISDLLKTRMKR
ncbi:Metallo-beta-lactamase family protein, RNA-specific [Dehalobacter sp. UNSWDHB]|jgi:metallo-beta-lactamase family protein|uniref:MBL fold metallo-hydrolase RNA specificity domain-containing protein n=1 Tax=unclassified Dehalobacter TaxID=2635733 RepID=UPI00028B9D61|nr:MULTISPECIES: MBL fold metallo-hydrolase [unclassified Dehalobacter]AFV01600.1 Metallo-beta-lactamase family protein, RNA-specific [Dehalobacter sp. DCA]AFV04635.1 Metallo-beta-lactamase family protein, RNA-specific [Dehalobacter sp. CF]EQB21970.1 Metallo-beta-lactamase family protein, RNA-specific [Dehalobacter sp. UNSWDHB]